MLSRKLVVAPVLAPGRVTAFSCTAATPANIHARLTGRVASAALANRLGLETNAWFQGAHPLYTARGMALPVTGSAERNIGAQLAAARPRQTAAATAALRRHRGDTGAAARNLASKLFVYPQAGAALRFCPPRLCRAGPVVLPMAFSARRRGALRDGRASNLR